MALHTFLLVLIGLFSWFSTQTDTISSLNGSDLVQSDESIASQSFFQFSDTGVEVITPESMTEDEKIFYIRDQW